MQLVVKLFFAIIFGAMAAAVWALAAGGAASGL
jgi:hypothetical protein